MNQAQIKRLYRLIAGICIVVFLIFGFRAVHELWDDILGDRLTKHFHSKLRDHEIKTERPYWDSIAAELTLLRDNESITDQDYQQTLNSIGERRELEYRESKHFDIDLHRAWQFMSGYQDWSWALTFGSIALLSAFVYRYLWCFCDRSVRYVRDGTEAPLSESPEESNKS